MFFQLRLIFICLVGPENFKKLRGDLIDGLRTIDRAVWFVWIISSHASLNELVHGLAANRLTSVGSIVLVVMFSCPIHDRRNPHHRRFSSPPVLLRREVEKS